MVIVYFLRAHKAFLGISVALLTLASVTVLFGYVYISRQDLFSKVALLGAREASLSAELASASGKLQNLEAQDQVKINKELEGEIKNIQKSYQTAVESYEGILKLEPNKKTEEKLGSLLANSLKLLSERKYASAESVLAKLNEQLKEEGAKANQVASIPENIQTIKAPPSSGFKKAKVDTDGGSFLVSIVSADLNSTRVVVDTASEGDCGNDCPVLPLADYVSRNGAFAGVNGSYFCPSTYPSCQGRANSFDTLLMNKNKKYFNSDNNVYSTVPAVIFQGSSVRFVSQSLEWGRDTGVDGVIANYPLLVLGNEIKYTGGSDDGKLTSRGNRSFVGATGSAVYIGVVHGATVAESAKVVHSLGIHNALNLDSGGSTALWSGGYKVGPGRSLPNAVLFVRK